MSKPQPTKEETEDLMFLFGHCAIENAFENALKQAYQKGYEQGHCDGYRKGLDYEDK